MVLATIAACSDGDASTRAAAGPTSRAASSTTTATTRPARPPAPPSTVAAPPGAAITQPAQPTSGFGSSALPHGDWRVSSGGEGADAWFVFEPVDPKPAHAPVAVILHGYYEYSGYETMYELIRHTVRTGTIVVYPRWQTDLAVPCPGSFDIEPCVQSALAGIRGGLGYLEADPSRVQPELDRTSYVGFSFGGIVTANLTNRYRELGLPEPQAIFLDDPHDGGHNGMGETALDRPLTGIPATTLVECHIGADGVTSEAGREDSSCNALFPQLAHIPDRNKALVMTHTDAHGQPPLGSGHGVCASREGEADAYDWGFCWKVWDALRAAADAGTTLDQALGDGPGHTDNGTWSDGTPIAPLSVTDAAPLRP
jgi:hypothetical protein